MGGGGVEEVVGVNWRGTIWCILYSDIGRGILFSTKVFKYNFKHLANEKYDIANEKYTQIQVSSSRY